MTNMLSLTNKHGKRHVALSMLLSGLFSAISFEVASAQLAYLSFELEDGERYQSNILLPEKNNDGLSQMVFQSLHSITLFTEIENKDDHKTPITKEVTYGLSVQSAAIDTSSQTYQFTIEYMGIPSIEIIDHELNQLALTPSPQDIMYKVNLTLNQETSACSSMSKSNGIESQFSSTFCLSIPRF